MLPAINNAYKDRMGQHKKGSLVSDPGVERDSGRGNPEASAIMGVSHDAFLNESFLLVLWGR